MTLRISFFLNRKSKERKKQQHFVRGLGCKRKHNVKHLDIPSETMPIYVCMKSSLSSINGHQNREISFLTGRVFFFVFFSFLPVECYMTINTLNRLDPFEYFTFACDFRPLKYNHRHKLKLLCRLRAAI